MNKADKISINITEDEYIKHVLSEVLDVDPIKKILHEEPTLMLFAAMFSKETWEALCKFSRMQQLAEKLNDTKEA